MKLGIVVLNYNDYTTTLKLINRVKFYDNLNYIVVVDNHSSDDSYEMLKENNDNTWTLLSSSENKGYAAGNNIGIKYLMDNFNVDIIGIVNPDVIFSNDFIDEIKYSFENNPGYSVITGLQLKPDGSISKRAFWQDLNLKRLLISNSVILSRIFNPSFRYISSKLKEDRNIINVPVVEGCCFFINAVDMKKIGYLDENTFLFCEEDILAKRIHLIGKKIGINKNIKFVHAHSTTIRKVLSQLKMIRIGLQSKRYLMKAYISNKNIYNIFFDISCVICVLEYIFILYPYARIRIFYKKG